MIDAFTIVGILVSVGAIVAYAKWDISISCDLLQDWATREGLEIIESKHKALFRGPFTWNSRKEQAVYYIKARTPNGKVRAGWVRLANNSWDVDVKWNYEESLTWARETPQAEIMGVFERGLNRQL
jgi:hypothetical protein